MTAFVHRLAVSVFVLLSALIVSVPAALAAFPGKNGRIAFQRGSEPDIYTVQPNGSGLTQLTSAPSFDGQPVWSPDGSKIVFWGAGAGGLADIFVMNRDGSGLANITNTSASSESEPSWSHDGLKILFTEDSSSGVDIFVMDADGTDRTQLTTDAAFDAQAAWSPDGARVAYITSPGYPDGDFDIATINPNGTGKTVIAAGPEDDVHPDWSPDGTRIVFARDLTRFAGEHDVWVMNANGTGQTRLTSTPEADMAPAFSPDGTKIVFQGEGFPADLFTMNPDGTGRANVTNDSVSDDFPDWQPITNHVRPKSANSIKVSLVPAFNACTASNRQHGPPLDSASCNPPVPASTAVTTATMLAGGDDANLVGRITLRAQIGIPGPPEDSDLLFGGSVTDVRCLAGTTACGSANSAGGADYAGTLQGNATIRMTDRWNATSAGGGSVPATSVDIPLPIDFSCASTASTAEGGLCTVSTSSFNALVPGSVKDGKRTVFEVGQLFVFDGGPDGSSITTPNTLFLRQGVFVP